MRGQLFNSSAMQPFFMDGTIAFISAANVVFSTSRTSYDSKVPTYVNETDTQWGVVSSASSNAAFSAKVTGDAATRFSIAASGSITWGAGTGAADVTLARSGSATLALTGSLTVSTLTSGSVVFAGASGLLSQNTSGFVWDNSNVRLGIGTSSPAYVLQIRRAGGAGSMGITVDQLGSTIQRCAYMYSIGDDTTRTTGYAMMVRNGDASDVHGLVVTGSQFVGVGGVTDPQGHLHSAGRIHWSEVAADPSAASLTSGSNVKDRMALYMKSDKFVIAYNNSGTVTYVTIPLDGSTTTWTHSTSAP